MCSLFSVICVYLIDWLLRNVPLITRLHLPPLTVFGAHLYSPPPPQCLLCVLIAVWYCFAVYAKPLDGP